MWTFYFVSQVDDCIFIPLKHPQLEKNSSSQPRLDWKTRHLVGKQASRMCRDATQPNLTGVCCVFVGYVKRERQNETLGDVKKKPEGFVGCC